MASLLMFRHWLLRRWMWSRAATCAIAMACLSAAPARCATIDQLQDLLDTGQSVRLFDVLMAEDPASPAIETWVREQAVAGHPVPQSYLAILATQRGDVNEALYWYGQARFAKRVDEESCTDEGYVNAARVDALLGLVDLSTGLGDLAEENEEALSKGTMVGVARELGKAPNPGPLWICGRASWIRSPDQRADRDRRVRHMRWEAQAIAERIELQKIPPEQSGALLHEYVPPPGQTSREPVFWLDDDRLYVKGVSYEKSRAHPGPDTLWNIATSANEVSLVIPWEARILCAYQGSVRYSVEQADGWTVEYWGPFGSAREVGRYRARDRNGPVEPGDFNAHSCEPGPSTEGEYRESIRHLLPGHGDLIRSPDNEDYESGRTADGTIVPLPVPMGTVVRPWYLPYMGAYYFPPYPSIEGEEEPEAGFQGILYDPLAKDVRTIWLRRGPWDLGDTNYMPTRKGLIAWTRADHDWEIPVGVSGLYFVNPEGRARRVIRGAPKMPLDPVYSPDGCRFAVQVDPALTTTYGHLYVVDVCRGGDRGQD